MQEASEQTVLGNFNNATLTHYGVTSTFFKKDGRFWVRTDGPDGKLQDYPIRYAFGVHPLQQYLVEFPGGRLQALSLSWDTRSRAQGGQRWFHLYPDEKIGHDDELHWTGPNQNWNNMCAECHSTNLEKGYDPVSRAFSTTWSEIDVSCEACHGPGSAHVSWARREAGWEKLGDSKGLALLLDERKDVHWAMDPQTGDAARSKIRNSSREIEMCARCHARRSPISRDYVHGESLLDHYLPRLLDDGMYHADGQIDDEVYVYGSFLQSRMYQAGVTCSDCHEPHSTKLRIPGNGVCLQCHLGSKYDQPGHHFHKAGTDGARCAECHMPPKSYMVVDPRHDHSMRIPRPDLSVALGTPNACSHCHQDKSAAWADRQVKAWYGKQTAGFQGYAAALHGARHGEPGSGDALAALVRETRTPAIARATALTAIGPYLSQSTLDVLPTGLSDSDPLVRQAAVGLLDRLPVQMRAANALPLLDDPVRAVRIEAARVLAPLPADTLSGEQQARLKQVTDEYVEAQLVSAERPEAQTNLGDLYAAMGQSDNAVTAYRTASELNPGYTPAYVNLADHYRAQGDENRVETVLREAVGRIPGDASIHHALGLALVRQKRLPEAVEELRLAANLAPNDVRYTYVYAVALNSSGKEEQAIQILRGVHERHPGNREILSALVAFHRDAGNSAAARSYADKLQKLSP